MTQPGSAADEQSPANPTTSTTVDAPITRRARREAEALATRKGRASVAATPAPTAAVQAVATQASALPASTSAAQVDSEPTDVRPAAAVTRRAPVRATAARSSRAAAFSRSADAGAARGRSTQSAPSRKRKFLAPVVLTVAAGLFGTMAVPAAFATTQDPNAVAAQAAADARTAQSQQLDVSAAVAVSDTTRDGYGATSQSTLDARKAAADAAAKAAADAAAEAEDAAHAQQIQSERAATAKQYASYTGPTAEQYAASASAANTPFSLPAVVQTAKQYIGTPYVFGGATPAGFDCSGYVMFVYAQYGIQLAHSVPLQDQAGTTIPISEAQPGDVVIFNNEAHDGFYMGNGMIMDAPKPGGAVSIRPIWTSDYHIVRFGI